MNRKGIILAGGRGSRLFPTTLATPKSLLPIYDKPLIYYSISTLMLAGIREILVISTPEHVDNISKLLGNGSNWGLNIQYAVQHEPKGIADALIIAEDFLDKKPCVLCLGDNIFYGSGFENKLKKAYESKKCTIFSYKVPDPERFGICELDENNKVISIEEKPANPKSNLAVTGLYFYDGQASEMAKTLEPSPRGEFEITDLNIKYMNKGNLFCQALTRGFAWIDAGTTESFFDASAYVRTIERRQGSKIACLEEIALEKNWQTKKEILRNIDDMKSSDYGKYIMKIIK
ncbi:glucose-1-phosphate thymidylyltransferase RfbA [Gammaproteobacteria bacterium]|nr:glucose-1-phosphate thymidylyltransferase RfbA [Gammaproteobacteria bacterium]